MAAPPPIVQPANVAGGNNTPTTAQAEEDEGRIAKMWHRACPTLRTIILPKGKVWFQNTPASSTTTTPSGGGTTSSATAPIIVPAFSAGGAVAQSTSSSSSISDASQDSSSPEMVYIGDAQSFDQEIAVGDAENSHSSSNDVQWLHL